MADDATTQTSFDLPLAVNVRRISAADVVRVMAETANEITPERAAGVVAFIQAWGDAAPMAVGGDFGRTGPDELDYLAFCSALEELGRPELTAKRLRELAECADFQAAKRLESASERYGKEAFFRQRERTEEADFEKKLADAAQALHDELEEEAHQLRLQALTFEQRAGQTAQIISLFAPRAA